MLQNFAEELVIVETISILTSTIVSLPVCVLLSCLTFSRKVEE